MIFGCTYEQIFTSPLILALAALIIVYARLKTAELNGKLNTLIDRNATKDAADAAARPPTREAPYKVEPHG